MLMMEKPNPNPGNNQSGKNSEKILISSRAEMCRGVKEVVDGGRGDGRGSNRKQISANKQPK